MSDDDLKFGPFWLSRQRRELGTDKGPIVIGARAFDVLLHLLDRPGRLVTKNELLDLVWPGLAVEENNLHVQIATLRRALTPHQELIQTVPGRGYRYVGDIKTPNSTPPPVPVASNLPAPLGRLIGREDELAALQGLVRESRLVTIAGPSGIGKTRLATALGHAVGHEFPGGVWLIDLAPLTAPNLVEAATITALGLRLPETGRLTEGIAAAIKQKALFLFDNCEHLLDAVSSLAEALLRHCPLVSLIATSQEPLRLESEMVYRLDPLALPPRGAGPKDVGQFGAVALFTRRAEAADRRFKLNADTALPVAEICRRLDGIPLALEMAAARVPALGIEGLRTRLDERLRLLTAGVRTAEARHRTLRDMVAWSHDLLDQPDQLVFRRLGVFAGGFSVAAAAAVAATGEVDEAALMDALGRLVDKSLVVAEAGEAPRYRLLETLRLFALEKLRAAGEHGHFAMRHAAYFGTVMDVAYEEWETTDDAVWLARMTPELDNFRSALDFALGSPAAPVLGISLAGSVALLWDRLSLLDESRRYLTRAEALLTMQTPPAYAARLYRQIGHLWHISDRPRALMALEQARGRYDALGDAQNLGAVLGLIGAIRTFLGPAEDAVRVLEHARTILENGPSLKSVFNVFNNLGVLAAMRDDWATSRHNFEQALLISRRSGASGGQAMVLVNLAEVEFNLGEIDSAIERARAAVSFLRLVNRQSDLGWALVNLATYLLLNSRLKEAEPVAREALSFVRRAGGLIFRACLQQWALLTAAAGNLGDAARLIGWVDAAYIKARESRQPTEQRVYIDLKTRLDEGLSTISLLRFSEEGAAWSEEQAAEFVIGLSKDN